ncbi:MAG TPA: hypothetical protein PLK31_12150, partial [Chloroflexota bacterium]|nr:hypothetical protein [Chloroflexota bacterium]
MKSKVWIVLALLVAFVAMASVASAQPEAKSASPDSSGHARVYNEAEGETESAIYIIQLTGEPLATYTGGIAGLEATSPLATGARKLDAKSPASLAYEQYLADKQDQFVAAMNSELGRSVD